MNALVIDIAREDEAWPDLTGLIERAVAAAIRVGNLQHRADAELSVVLADDAHIRTINAAWRGKDKPTNVLSFPAAGPDRIASSPLLGDVILARETVEREAAEAGRPLADHVTHLVIHGFLHLFGYDHEDEADAIAMEALEIRILAELGIADPYAEAA